VQDRIGASKAGASIYPPRALALLRATVGAQFVGAVAQESACSSASDTMTSILNYQDRRRAFSRDGAGAALIEPAEK